jgi:hypothetical protein
MIYFLLIITVNMANGYKSISVEKFNSSYECFKAMELINKQGANNVSLVCEELPSEDYQ